VGEPVGGEPVLALLMPAAMVAGRIQVRSAVGHSDPPADLLGRPASDAVVLSRGAGLVVRRGAGRSTMAHLQQRPDERVLE